MCSFRDLVLTKSECSSASVLSRDNLEEERGQWAVGNREAMCHVGPSNKSNRRSTLQGKGEIRLKVIQSNIEF